ncbi:MAG: hypothetical protein ACR2HR_10320 [Euzebya sp.]
MSTSPNPEVSRLATVLNADPPPSLQTLDPAVVTRLTDAVLAESHRQSVAVMESVDHALRLVPRPFRGIVRRLIQP